MVLSSVKYSLNWSLFAGDYTRHGIEQYKIQHNHPWLTGDYASYGIEQRKIQPNQP